MYIVDSFIDEENQLFQFDFLIAEMIYLQKKLFYFDFGTMRNVVGVIIGGLFLLTSFSVFAETPQSVLDYCSSVRIGGCTSSQGSILVSVEESFLKLKQSLANKPTPLIAVKIDQYIARAKSASGNVENSVKNEYLSRRLQQRQVQIREKLESISLDAATIRRLRSQGVTDEMFYTLMRREVLKYIAASGYTKFITKPYGTRSGISVDSGGNLSVESIFIKDDLDHLIQKRRNDNKAKSASEISFSLSPKEKDAFPYLYLFKNKADLDALGYQLVSNRARVNTDAEYRRFNIKTSLDNIGPVRVLLPNETIAFLTDAKFDPVAKKNYKVGKVIASDEEVDDYGGGLCGGATALYQGIVSNAGLRPAMRNHSKFYKSLYTATIDGVRQSTPGLDATVYSSQLDLKITNIRNYPIIVVMNYDGTYNGVESIFTLSKVEDKGSLEYVSKRPYKAKMNVKGGGTKTVNGQCHTWIINGKKQERCYKEIK